MIRRTSLSLAAAAVAVAGGLAFAQPAQAQEQLVNVNLQSGTQINPDVAVNPADGSYVVVYQSLVNDAGDIYLRRYNNLGQPQDVSPVLVNTGITAGRQSRPAVALAPNGNFVVTWESDNGDGDSFGVYARRGTLGGGLVAGNEFLVNSTTAGEQTAPDVAMDDAGNFIIVYESTALGDYNLRARAFTAAGTGGTEQAIDLDANGNEQLPRIAVNDAGTSAVIVYRDSNIDGSGYGVGGRLVPVTLSTGTIGAPGTQFLVNNINTAGDQDEPAVDMDGTGNFVVVWESGADESRDVYARTYTAAGTALTNEFLVNSENTSLDQYAPDVAFADSTPGTNFTVTYTSDETETNQVYAKTYTFNPLTTTTAAYRVNTTGPGTNPAIDADNAGNYVIAYEAPDTENSGIYVNRFAQAGTVVTVGTPFATNNQCPTASFFTTQSPSTQPGAVRLTIDASGSSDPDGDTLTYTYEVRNSNNVLVNSNTTTNSTQQFDLSPGDYTVTVRVSDGDVSCDTTEGSDVSSQPVFIEQTSTFNSSVNAAGFVVPDNGGKKVELSFWGAFNKNGLGGGISLKDPRFGGTTFKSTNITSVFVSGNQGTITGFGTIKTNEGTFQEVPFTATGIDIYPSFVGRGDRVNVEISGFYSLSGTFNTGDVTVVGGQAQVAASRTR